MKTSRGCCPCLSSGFDDDHFAAEQDRAQRRRQRSKARSQAVARGDAPRAIDAQGEKNEVVVNEQPKPEGGMVAQALEGEVETEGNGTKVS